MNEKNVKAASGSAAGGATVSGVGASRASAVGFCAPGQVIKTYTDSERPMAMRGAKAAKHALEEKALLEAIIEERGDGPVAHPTKEANSGLR
jgi:hypothetical protein